MGKEITVRGKKWERKNSLWVIWSFFGFSSISFLNIGIKAKEKKWIITGIIYFVVLWGGMIIAGDMPEKAGEILADAMMILYIVSIVHPFLVRKSYLKKYDMILRNNEVELEREKTKRAKESLERANEIRNIENEAKKVSENLKDNEQIQVEEGDKKEEQVSNDIEKKQEQRKQNSNNVQKDIGKKTNNINKDSNSFGLGGIISGIVTIAIIVWVATSIFDIGGIKNGDEAEIECKSALTNNVFIIAPKERQVDVKAVDGKDGMVIVKVIIKDDELLKYSLYGKDVKEIYYGYEPAANGHSHYQWFGETEEDVKEKMGW